MGWQGSEEEAKNATIRRALSVPDVAGRDIASLARDPAIEFHVLRHEASRKLMAAVDTFLARPSTNNEAAMQKANEVCKAAFGMF